MRELRDRTAQHVSAHHGARARPNLPHRCVSSAAELSSARHGASTAPTSQTRSAHHGAPPPQAAWTALMGDAAGDALNTAAAIAEFAQGGGSLPKQGAGSAWLHDAFLWWRPARSGAPDDL